MKSATSPKCSNCFKPHDAHTSIGGKHREPKIGDLSVCLYCAQICIYDKDLKLLNVTEAELRFLKDYQPVEYRQLMHAAQIIKENIRKN